jgi:hypothetical protein
VGGTDFVTHWAFEDSSAGAAEGTPLSVRRAQRFLEIVDVIAAANRILLPSMTEKYFRRMVLRMAEHQLLYEEYQIGQEGRAPGR